MSNFPLRYKLSWLPRLLKPSLARRVRRSGCRLPRLMSPTPAAARRLVFIGDISAVANRTAPAARRAAPRADRVGPSGRRQLREPRRRDRAETVGNADGARHAMTAAFLSGVLDAAGIERTAAAAVAGQHHMLDQGVDRLCRDARALGAMGIATIGATADGPDPRRRSRPRQAWLRGIHGWRDAGWANLPGGFVLDDLRRRLRRAENSAGGPRLCRAALGLGVPAFSASGDPSAGAASRGRRRRADRRQSRPRAATGRTDRRDACRLWAGRFPRNGVAAPALAWAHRHYARRRRQRRAGDQGRVASYELVPFFRLRDGARERLRRWPMSRGHRRPRAGPLRGLFPPQDGPG